MKPKNWMNILAAAILLAAQTVAFAQTRPETFVIKNMETGLVLDIDAGCDMKPANTTDGASACDVILSPYTEGKKSQYWKITDENGFLTLQNLAFARIISAGPDKAILNRSFPVNTNYFKPVAAKDGNYVLLQGVFDEADKDENNNPKLKIAYNTLQPFGHTIRIAPFDEKQETIQSWKFIPVKDAAIDFSGVINKSNTITGPLANDVSKKLLDPARAKTLVDQATNLKNKNDYAGAEKLSLQAVELDPGSETAWNLLGIIARDQHQWEKAISYFQKEVTINPKANIAFANLAYCYDFLGKPNEAVENYTKAIESSFQLGVQPESYFYNNRGAVYLKLHKTSEALADYRKALERDPKNAMAQKNLDQLTQSLQNNSSANTGNTTFGNAGKTTEEEILLYPNINKFSEINEYVTRNFVPIYKNKIITAEILQKLNEISKHIDEYSEDLSHGPTYYGTVKRVQANYYYIAGIAISRAPGFAADNNRMNLAKAYFKKSIDVEHSFNHFSFPPDLKFTRTTDVQIDPATGDYTTFESSESHHLNAGFMRAYRSMAYIQLMQNEPDSALLNFVHSAGEENDGKPIEDFTVAEFTRFIHDWNIFAKKAHSFNQEYIKLCINILGETAIKAYPDSKRDVEKAAVVELLNRLVTYAAQSPEKIQYTIEYPFPDAIARWDYGLILPAFYILNKAGKLSYKGHEADRMFTENAYILQSQNIDENTRQMAESLLKDQYAGYMQNAFMHDAYFDKKKLNENSYSYLLWYQSLSEKYPISEAAAKLLANRIDYCHKKFKKAMLQPVSYKGLQLYQPAQ